MCNSDSWVSLKVVKFSGIVFKSNVGLSCRFLDFCFMNQVGIFLMSYNIITGFVRKKSFAVLGEKWP